MTNTKSTPFVLPTGISLALGGNSLVIRHAGDVVLEQTLGRRLSRVEAGGDLTLRLSPITGVLNAGGTVHVEGDVDAQELRGRIVRIDDVKVRARTIVAEEAVIIGRATLSVDVIVAPRVEIDPNASGRVRIVDCLNEQSPTRVRGCLSLADYEADFGGAAEFMARRGVTPVSSILDQLDTAEPAPPPLEDVVMVDTIDDATIEDADDPATDASATAATQISPLEYVDDEPLLEEISVEIVDDDEPSEATVLVAISPDDDDDAFVEIDDEGAFVEVDDDEDVGDIDSEEIRAPRPPRRVARPSAGKVRKALRRLEQGYDQLPPPAMRVVQLIRSEDFDYLAEHLDTLWCDLLRHHQQHRENPPRPAILSFHQLHSMLD